MADETGHIAVTDLHFNLGELADQLRAAARRGDALDAYLLACGMAQVIADWWEAADSAPRRLTALLGERGGARTALRVGVNAANAAVRTALPSGDARRLRSEVDELVAVLAAVLVERTRQDSGMLPRTVVDLGRRVAGSAAGRLPAGLAESLVRPPSCFRSFDQHPRDCVELAQRFALAYDAQDVPVLVLGVRTSGGYLAPLIAAALRAKGFRHVGAATARPGGSLPAALRNPGHNRVRGRELVAIVDDPPTTGGSIARIARAVRRQGLPAGQVVGLFATFEGAPPARLPVGMPCITLPAEAWHIRQLLEQPSIDSLVRAALPGRDVIEVRAKEPGLPNRESHLGVDVTAKVRASDGILELALRAEAAGIGYFGRHARDVAAHLGGRVPRIHALRDGVILRERGTPVAQLALEPAEIAAYVAARRDRLQVPRDRSAALRGRQPVWEIGGRILSLGYGRLGPMLRPLLIDRALRRMLTCAEPCLADGRTAFGAWEAPADATGGPAHKTEFDDGCFGHLDLACYDAAFDLAGAAVARSAAGSDHGAAGELLAAYAACTDSAGIDRARWFVYEYVQAWNLERVSKGWQSKAEARQALARAAQRFFGELFLADIDTEPAGPWVVLDVDGVLELDFGGVPVTTLAAMRALRALRAHGYRVLLATGRSLPEVRDRCAAYRLAGGVAEYGAVAYDAAAKESTPIPEAVTGDARAALVAELQANPDLRIDSLYRWCARVSEAAPGAGSRGLRGLALSSVAAAHSAFVPVLGEAQTDFVPAGVEKSLGVRALMKQLGAADEPVALAVGDTSMDLGILRMAELGLAPAHASTAVRAAGVRRTRAAYQAGLAEAVARLIEHRPGSCVRCAPPQLTSAELFLATLLSAGERGRRGLLPSAFRLAMLRPEGGAA